MLKTGKLVTTGPDCDRPFERGGRDFNSTKKTFCLICVRFGRFEKNVNVKYETLFGRCDRDALQKGTRSFFLPGKMMSVHCQRRGKSEMTRDVAGRNKSPVEGFFPRAKYNGLIGLLRLPRR